MMDLEGQNVLGNGASRGIGRATAELMAECGARVAVHYARNRVAVEGVLGELPGDGHFTVAADLGDTVSLEALADGVFDRFGLDVLVNNAGVFELHSLTSRS